MSIRVVVPELLDHLPTADPEAQRSRRDLRRINFLMGNEHWVCRTLGRFSEIAERGIVEMGAGDGILSDRMAKRFPKSTVVAYDLAPRPVLLDSRVCWRQGDLFTMPLPESGGVRVANLFLHHFEGDTLRELGKWCETGELVIFCEPDRAMLPHLLGGLMHPFINRVTRHDMHISISAGFAGGEIPRMLGFDQDSWRFVETWTWRGARRVIGWRS